MTKDDEKWLAEVKAIITDSRYDIMPAIRGRLERAVRIIEAQEKEIARLQKVMGRIASELAPVAKKINEYMIRADTDLHPDSDDARICHAYDDAQREQPK